MTHSLLSLMGLLGLAGGGVVMAAPPEGLDRASESLLVASASGGSASGEQAAPPVSDVPQATPSPRTVDEKDLWALNSGAVALEARGWRVGFQLGVPLGSLYGIPVSDIRATDPLGASGASFEYLYGIRPSLTSSFHLQLGLPGSLYHATSGVTAGFRWSPRGIQENPSPWTVTLRLGVGAMSDHAYAVFYQEPFGTFGVDQANFVGRMVLESRLPMSARGTFRPALLGRAGAEWDIVRTEVYGADGSIERTSSLHAYSVELTLGLSEGRLVAGGTRMLNLELMGGLMTYPESTYAWAGTTGIVKLCLSFSGVSPSH